MLQLNELIIKRNVIDIATHASDATDLSTTCHISL